MLRFKRPKIKFVKRPPKSRKLIVVSATSIAIVLWLAVSLLNIGHKNASDQASANAKAAIVPHTDSCASSPTFSCYKGELQGITASDGPESAVALLKNQYSKISYIKSQCHQLMHVVGRAALSKYGGIADTYAHGDQFCWSGYYHGALEQLADSKGVDFLVKNSNQICAGIPGKDTHSFYYYNCVHGLGHGYMFVESGALFKSLTDCDSLIEDFDRTSCYGGVFMQNIMNEQTPDSDIKKTQAYLKADEPMYPCTAVEDKYRYQCYLMQTSYALQVENYNFAKVFTLCGQIEQKYRDTCYTSLGRDASGQSISDVTLTRQNCLFGPTLEARRFCIHGAAMDFVSYFHSDTQAKQLCDSLSSDLSGDCLNTVSSYYSSF